MCNIKYPVPESPIFQIMVTLYDFSILDTYSFTFDSHLIIVIPSINENGINKMKCYFFPCGLLFETNIIIASIIVLCGFI